MVHQWVYNGEPCPVKGNQCRSVHATLSHEAGRCKTQGGVRTCHPIGHQHLIDTVAWSQSKVADLQTKNSISWARLTNQNERPEVDKSAMNWTSWNALNMMGQSKCYLNNRWNDESGTCAIMQAKQPMKHMVNLLTKQGSFFSGSSGWFSWQWKFMTASLGFHWPANEQRLVQKSDIGH